MKQKQIMMIAGEASGDMHGAKLAQALKKYAGGVSIFGIGGPAMHEQSVRILIDAHTLSVVGITEVFSKLPVIYRSLTTVKNTLRKKRPDLLILIDFPDFNFLVGAAAKKMGIPVLYYISPQIWAWRQNRVKKIKQFVDHMAVIFPFEPSFYRKHHVPVTFVGHPLLDRTPMAVNKNTTPSEMDRPVIGLVPGSREKEVSTLLPVMLEAALKIQRKFPKAKFAVSCARSIPEKLISQITLPYMSSFDLEIVKGPAAKVFEKSHLLVATSGTVTLEAALYGVPMVIVYQVSPLSYQLGKRLIKVKHIGIVNLVVDKALLPELIQEDASPPMIGDNVIELLRDPERLNRIREELLGVRDRLGGPGASDRVAAIAMKIIRTNSK
jgi:lipid-A-disaccharide synthase